MEKVYARQELQKYNRQYRELTNFTTILRLQADYRRVPSGFCMLFVSRERDACSGIFAERYA